MLGDDRDWNMETVRVVDNAVFPEKAHKLVDIGTLAFADVVLTTRYNTTYVHSRTS